MALASGQAQIAVRDNTLYTPSLTRIAPLSVLTTPADKRGWRLDQIDDGGIETLGFIADDRATRPLERGQIRVDVRAAGLNFYDVAFTIGVIAKRHELGAEAAGIITEIGPGVTNFEPGDRVVMIADGCFGPCVVADQRMVSKFPEHWSFAQAASVPIAFVTAYCALVEIAKIKPGERLLVHAGAGGVGQAAIQLGHYFGAEVFVTASPKKWRFLRRLGIPSDHIANSRTLDFATQFRAVSEGAGIDVAINTLTGGFIDETLSIMNKGGRFVEIGKSEVRDAQAIADVYPLLNYHHLEWSVSSEIERTQHIFAVLMKMFKKGLLEPLPVIALDIQRAQDAFRLMQRGHHIGKIVLAIPRRLDPEGTVLITGGTGTLGALLAEHLASRHGARHLLLVSRSGSASPEAAAIEKRLIEHGANVTVRACDVADRTALKKLLDDIPSAHPLNAVFHTAGVLADATIKNMTPAQIRQVFLPKVDAAWHLHELTKSMDLSAFIVYSSINGVLGNAGQGNYAAANAFLDALAFMRRRCGLVATSLGWGWWQPVSNLSRNLSAADTARIARIGFVPISAEYGHMLLDYAIHSPFSVLAASPFSQQTLDENSEAGTLHPLLSQLASTLSGRRGRSTANKAADLVRELKGLNHSARKDKAEAVITQLTLATLGIGAGTRIDTEVSFKDLGIDSLMSLSLRNQINLAFGLRLPATLIYDIPSPHALTIHVIERLFPQADGNQDVINTENTMLSDAQVRAMIMAIPIANLREAGLLKDLLALGSAATAGHCNGQSQTMDEIKSASIDELLKIANLQTMEDLR